METGPIALSYDAEEDDDLSKVLSDLSFKEQYFTIGINSDSTSALALAQNEDTAHPQSTLLYASNCSRNW